MGNSPPSVADPVTGIPDNDDGGGGNADDACSISSNVDCSQRSHPPNRSSTIARGKIADDSERSNVVESGVDAPPPQCGSTDAPQAVDAAGTATEKSKPIQPDLISRLKRKRRKLGRIINSKRMQFFIVILISINAIMMGIGTFPFVTDNPSVEEAFETIDFLFLCVFTIELALQFLYRGYTLIFNGWLVFDLVVVTLSWTFDSVQVIRAFRIFRAFRLITRVKTMKNLVLALFGVLPRMAAISMMLMLIFYIFAVMFTQLFKDLFREGFTEWDYFGRLDFTLFTLFQIMTFDGWAEIVREVIVVHTWAWIPLVIFLVISGFIIFNLIIAVICDAVAALHDDEKNALHGSEWKIEDEDNILPDSVRSTPLSRVPQKAIPNTPVPPMSRREYLYGRQARGEGVEQKALQRAGNAVDDDEDKEDDDGNDIKSYVRNDLTMTTTFTTVSGSTDDDVDNDGHEEDDDFDSDRKLDEQIHILENQVQDLTIAQAQTAQRLQLLTRRLQERRTELSDDIIAEAGQ